MMTLKPRPRPETALAQWLDDNRILASDLARAVGVDKSTISRLVHGTVSASDDLAARIKKITGLKKI